MTTKIECYYFKKDVGKTFFEILFQVKVQNHFQKNAISTPPLLAVENGIEKRDLYWIKLHTISV